MENELLPKRTQDQNQAEDLEIFIKVDRPENLPPARISAETFFKASKGMLDVMREVDQALNDGKPSIRWEIADLRMGSNTVTYAMVPLQPRFSAKATRDAFVDGIRSIQDRAMRRPRAFTDKALRKLRGIVASLPSVENVLLVGLENDPTSLNMEAVAQIDLWLEARYHAMGSIEGHLEDVKGAKHRCVVHDRLGRQIDCYFKDADKEKIKAGLFGRVAIQGLISYRADGSPVSVKLNRIAILRSASQMPPIRSLMGTWKLDVSTEEHLRSLHGE